MCTHGVERDKAGDQNTIEKNRYILKVLIQKSLAQTQAKTPVNATHFPLNLKCRFPGRAWFSSQKELN